MSRVDTKAARAYARSFEDRELPPCVHGREPVDRCEQCNGETVDALCAEVDALRAALREWQNALHQRLPNEPVPHRDVNPPSSLGPKDIGAAIDVFRKDNAALRAAITQALVQLETGAAESGYDLRPEVALTLRAALGIKVGP